MIDRCFWILVLYRNLSKLYIACRWLFEDQEGKKRRNRRNFTPTVSRNHQGINADFPGISFRWQEGDKCGPKGYSGNQGWSSRPWKLRATNGYYLKPSEGLFSYADSLIICFVLYSTTKHNVYIVIMQKERRIRDHIRSQNCIVKKLKKHHENRLDREILTSQVELRLVSRVLNLSRLTTDQLVWCQKKLKNISFVGKKVHIEPSFLLFPC